MGITKIKLLKRNKSKLLVVAIIAVLAVILIVLNTKKPEVENSNLKTEPTSSESSSSKPSLTPSQKAENGIYTNYKYGFRLRYPKDLFIKHEVDDPNTVRFYTSTNLGIPEGMMVEKYPEDIFFSLFVLGNDEFPYFEFKDFYDKSVKYRGQVGIQNANYDVLFKNMEIIQNNNREISINYNGSDLYTTENIKKFNIDDVLATAHPQSYGLRIIILTNKFGVSISFSSANKKLIDSNYKLFKDIISSIETFDPQNPSSNPLN